MADRNVVNTATLDTLRTTYNSTAADVGDIASVTGASGVIGAATDIVEAITLMNTEVTGIKTGATTFASQIVFEGVQPMTPTKQLLQLQTQRQTEQLLFLMLQELS